MKRDGNPPFIFTGNGPLFLISRLSARTAQRSFPTSYWLQFIVNEGVVYLLFPIVMVDNEDKVA